MNDINLNFETLSLHGDPSLEASHNAIRFPVYSGVAYDFNCAEDMEKAFTFRKPAHAYSRITNPTVENFERKLNLLEKGLGTVALSSGMAAITTFLLTVLQHGDNLIASKYLFGNTYSLLKETLAPLGIETRFVDIENPEEIERNIDANTRLLLTETISNPQMVVPDFSILAEIAEKHKLILTVDGTVTTPYLFQGKDFGAHIILHSTTKYISGGATSVGGALVDLGTYDWKACPALKKYHKYGAGALLARLRMEVHRNFGSCLSPQAAYLQTLGLETLALRVKASCDNALAVASYLQHNKQVKSVNYPGLDSSTNHDLAKIQYNGMFGGVMSFELEDRESAFCFLNRLRLISRATNLNDNKSLIIHPASTIFSDCSYEEKEDMGVTDGLIRLSIGIENREDLIADISQAFES